ncbi:MAG: hypothetical protein AAFS10_13340 [Myxococcota bacterium]
MKRCWHVVLFLLLLWTLACSDGSDGSDGSGASDTGSAADTTTSMDASGEDILEGDSESGADDTTDSAMSEPDLPTTERQAQVGVDTDRVVAEISPRYLSVAVDTAQVVGGTFWNPDGSQGTTGNAFVDPYPFDHPKLRNLAAELAPAYLRIGGSDADLTWYDLSDDPVEEPPTADEWVMTREQWDRLNRFAIDLDFEVSFTLNVGPGARDADRVWQPENARTLIRYTVEQGYPVTLWELGNEINAFQAIHGLDWGISGQAYAEDFAAAKALIDQEDPGAPLAGPSSAYWPTVGEPILVYEDFMEEAGEWVDVVTWHYYPQQSSRCPLAVLEATPTLMLDPMRLAEADIHAAEVERVRDAWAPDVPIWLGESGHAQCGGALGVSDRFVSGFWWLDQLGRLAQRGHRVAVRQTLSGSDYGMLDDDGSFNPRPDYWNSVLWRRLMGTQVLSPLRMDDDAGLISYTHCTRGRAGTVTVLLINVEEDAITVSFGEVLGDAQERYRITTDDLLSKTWQLNGETQSASDEGVLPPLEPVATSGPLVMEPTSMAFVVFPNAGVSVCEGSP